MIAAVNCIVVFLIVVDLFMLLEAASNEGIRKRIAQDNFTCLTAAIIVIFFAVRMYEFWG